MISSRVEGSDLKDYVARTSVLNHEQLKAYKSMEAHNYRTSGFIHKPQFKEFGDNVIVREKVRSLFSVQRLCTQNVLKSTLSV